MSPARSRIFRIVIVGGGPAGLMAAEVARAGGAEVDLYEAKGSVGRKFLVAGKGGLNLTHSEDLADFLGRFAERRAQVTPWIEGFGPQALRTWARELGVETFIGSSGRVFPHDLRAAPLLRGWVRRLRMQGVRIHVHHRWTGWAGSGLRLATPDGERVLDTSGAAVVLALGGGSWPQLGSDGAWQPLLQAQGIGVSPLQPSNCGFDVDWSPHFAERHAGAPLKPVIARFQPGDGAEVVLQGECVVSANGIEGSLIYALSARIRQAIDRCGEALLHLDLAPGRSLGRLEAALSRPRGRRSLSEHLRRNTGLSGARLALVNQARENIGPADAAGLARLVKRLPLRLLRPRPLAEAISSAGGVRFEAMSTGLMLSALPGTFCAGEMIDWDAPTGGYLLNASLASGRHAATAALEWLAAQAPAAGELESTLSTAHAPADRESP